MTPARPSWPPSDEEIEEIARWALVAMMPQLRTRPATDEEVRRGVFAMDCACAGIRAVLAHFTPPAPEVVLVEESPFYKAWREHGEEIAAEIARRYKANSAPPAPEAIVMGANAHSDHSNGHNEKPRTPASEVASEELIRAFACELADACSSKLGASNHERALAEYAVKATLAKWGAARKEEKP